MSDSLADLLAAGAIPTTSYPPTSRYADVPTVAHDPGEGGDPVPHLARRIVPGPERFATVRVVRVVEGDRRDLLAHRHLGDVASWWRLADANGAVDPRALTDTVGRELRITLQEGAPGVDDG